MQICPVGVKYYDIAGSQLSVLISVKSQVKISSKAINGSGLGATKIQCTSDCHSVETIIVPLFVFVEVPPLGSKSLQRTQLFDVVGC